MSTKELERTLGLSELARSWAQRLHGGDVAGLDALVVVGGPAALLGRHFPLDRRAGRISISRGAVVEARQAGDEIALDSAFVSAPHAALEAVPEGWQIVDLQSSNHTYVGTVRVERQRLVYGDELRLGDVVLLFISAELERLPSHVVDAGSGLLAARIFEAEAAHLADSSTGGELQLLLVRCPGLRDQLAEPGGPSDLGELAHGIGAALLERLASAVVGRLEVDLFAAAWRSERAEARAAADKTRAAIAALVARRGFPTPRCVLCHDHSQGRLPLRLPQLLAGGIAELELAAQTLVEADLEEQRPILSEAQLLSALLAGPEQHLLLLTIADEDSLRHRLGNAHLAACRYRLQRLVSRSSSTVALLGVIGERVMVLGCREAAAAARLGQELAQRFQSDVSGVSDLAGEHLSVTLLAPDERREIRRGRELQRLLLEAAEGPNLLGGERLDVESLPAPLAAPYTLIWSLSSEAGRLRAVLQAAEMVSRFIACCALSALARWGSTESRSRLQASLKKVGRPCLSLGEWVALLRQLQPEVVEIEEPLGKLLALALAGGTDRPTPLSHLLERELLPARNAFAHGGPGAAEASGAKRFHALLDELHAILRALAPLKAAPLLAVLETRPRRGGGARAKVRLLAGPRENFEVLEVEFRAGPEPLFPGSVYLCSDDFRQALELQPLVRLQPCPRCDRDEIFIVEGLPPLGTRLDMRAISTGHPLRWRPSLEELSESWLRLLSGAPQDQGT